MSIESQLSLVSSRFTLKSTSQSWSQGTTVGQNPSQTALSSLQEKALNALAREIPGMESSSLKALDPAEYTPDKVAGRIGQFVAMGLENARASGKSEEEVQALYDSAVKGVEQGFKEAKEILSNLKLLDGPVAEQVEATEKATFEALAGLSPSQSGEGVTETTAMTGMAVAQRYQKAEDFELNLTTRDGDKVRVSFSRNLDAQGSFAVSSDGEGNRAAVMDLSRSESSQYAFSVEGDLSVDEIDAIQNLVRDVGKVANDFFSGDVQKAFEKVSDVAFDGSQLASMNLRMSRSEQFSAAKIYEGTQRLEEPEQARSGRRLGHMMRELRDSFEKPELGFLDQAGKEASNIMKGLVQQDSRFKDASEEQQTLYKKNFERLLSSLEVEK
ncbi:DUF5610 domain-containing protein [Thiocystis violacea]|uniref:DUF5610 domain-containing protein n=1 Tax=Thiocystis violacea TaxID=13725 RepID=UPI00190444B5|nr:DUF5610 domain-containing protein [Thiocystis violacea]MBK1718487.1 hypothetical protein [Thiocystis violacea]